MGDIFCNKEVITKYLFPNVNIYMRKGISYKSQPTFVYLPHNEFQREPNMYREMKNQNKQHGETLWLLL